jgi:mannonate dehydratase
MKKTWRWFGKDDIITLPILRQIGVEGIVTALHGVSNGDVWSEQQIVDTKAFIESHGLEWDVVESLPVAEEIKYGGKNRDQLIENYCLSLENLGRAGIKTVVYNFMPVIDWVRTDLHYPLPDGSQTLFFDRIRFAYFDCHILNRAHAADDYSTQELEQVERLHETITDKLREELIDTIIVKTQGFVNESFKGDIHRPVELFRTLLSKFEGVNKHTLRTNLKYFLQQVIPTAERYDMSLNIHPDDPPYSVLGLPRIAGNAQDIDWLLKAVPSESNGLTFCAGSLSAGLHNDVVQLAKRFCNSTHFVHLRSTDAFPNGNFIEASHFEGRGRLIELLRIFESFNPSLPFRVDHGKLLLNDCEKGYNPGYSFHGRMLALAQVEGMLTVVKDELKNF